MCVFFDLRKQEEDVISEHEALNWSPTLGAGVALNGTELPVREL